MEFRRRGAPPAPVPAPHSADADADAGRGPDEEQSGRNLDQWLCPIVGRKHNREPFWLMYYILKIGFTSSFLVLLFQGYFHVSQLIQLSR